MSRLWDAYLFDRNFDVGLSFVILLLTNFELIDTGAFEHDTHLFSNEKTRSLKARFLSTLYFS